MEVRLVLEARRRARAFLAMAATAVMLFAANAASAQTVDASASYVLVNRNSGKVLDVFNLATNDGARIAQWTRGDGAWQQ
jgi:D-alanyl-D-alanine carboxypeptidase